jgi:hypothetical protein
MELDALETKAVELLRSRLEKGSITALNAKVEPQAKDLVSVNGTFEDPEGHLSRFEVKFRVKQEKAQLVSWYVSG